MYFFKEKVMSSLSLFVLNISIFSMGMILIIVILYFTFTNNIEITVVKNNLDYVLKDLAEKVSVQINEKQKSELISNLDKILETSTFPEENRVIREKNRVLVFYSVLLVFSVLFIFGITSYTIIKYSRPKINYKKIIKENIYIWLSVLIVEIIVVLFIAGQYKTISKNKINRTIIEDLLDLRDYF